MPHWVPSWQLAVTVAACLAAVSLAGRLWLHLYTRRTGDPQRNWAVAAMGGWQVAILIAIYGMWQWVGSLALVGSGDGLERGQRLWDLERHLGLPSEKSFQELFLPHEWLIKFFDIYYVIAHYNVLLLTLGWLFWRHRDRYREARTVIALATFACLAVQLVPVAPPRLISGHGIVDTAMKYGQSVYGPVGQGFSDQYSAMPSVHICWSSAVAFFIWRSTKSRWRYIGVAHALLTWTVVVATGNHYWLDGIVAIVLLALSFWAVRLVHYLARRVSQWLPWTPSGAPAPVLASESVPLSSAASSDSLLPAAVQASPSPVTAGQATRAAPPSP
jgi:hypothetical protein